MKMYENVEHIHKNILHVIVILGLMVFLNSWKN